ncbi:hypothetical protein K7W42_20240, partial [Deinococcus sp. HMF7604]|uniref:hypothetical protein n=1 Tax=Deinococcus betulae TaxID=2873312 RepID=UPI001CCFFF47
MTSASRVGVIADAEKLDTAAEFANEQGELARVRRLELQSAASDLAQKKQQVDTALTTIPAAATQAATLATAQAKGTLDAATLAANQAASAASVVLATLPKFRSTTTANPTAPSQAELDANPNGLGGTRLT